MRRSWAGHDGGGDPQSIPVLSQILHPTWGPKSTPVGHRASGSTSACAPGVLCCVEVIQRILKGTASANEAEFVRVRSPDQAPTAVEHITQKNRKDD